VLIVYINIILIGQTV